MVMPHAHYKYDKPLFDLKDASWSKGRDKCLFFTQMTLSHQHLHLETWLELQNVISTLK